MVLGALGAEVWKIERPDSGDEARRMAPVTDEYPDLGAYFAPINRGKRSVVIDLSTAAGVEAVLKLAARCDIFVENFRGGKAESMGLSEARVRAVQPLIIYASLTAFGPRGPDRERPGYDALLQSRTGIVSVTGEAGSSGARAGVSLLDMGSGIWVALGILAALLDREHTGQGSRVDGSLFQTGAMWMAYHLVARQFTGRDPAPQGTRITAMAPYGDFPTADSSVLVGISNDRLYAKLCTVLNRPDLIGDARFLTNPLRVANRDALDAELEPILSTRTTSDWLGIFDRAGVPSSAIQTTGAMLADGQLAALGQMHPMANLGGVVSPAIPLEFSAFEVTGAGDPPRLGEHTRPVLESADFTSEEIEDLERRKIIQCLAKQSKSSV